MKRFEDWANDLADKIAAKGEDKKMSISYAPWESVVTKREYSTKDLFESLRPVQKVYASYVRRTYGEKKFKECVAWLARYNTGETPKSETPGMDTLVLIFEYMSPEQKHEFMTRVAGDPVDSMAKTYSLMTPKQKFCFLTSIGAWEEHAPHSPRLAKVSLEAYFDKEDIEEQ